MISVTTTVKFINTDVYDDCMSKILRGIKRGAFWMAAALAIAASPLYSQTIHGNIFSAEDSSAVSGVNVQAS